MENCKVEVITCTSGKGKQYDILRLHVDSITIDIYDFKAVNTYCQYIELKRMFEKQNQGNK